MKEGLNIFFRMFLLPLFFICCVLIFVFLLVELVFVTITGKKIFYENFKLSELPILWFDKYYYKKFFK